MQPKNKDRTSFVELFVCITIFIMLICLMLPVLQTAVKEKLRIREETKKLNLEILESKAKVWKAIENDPKLLTPNMIRVLDK